MFSISSGQLDSFVKKELNEEVFNLFKDIVASDKGSLIFSIFNDREHLYLMTQYGHLLLEKVISPEITVFLIDKGAKPWEKNAQGKTPVQVLKRRKKELQIAMKNGENRLYEYQHLSKSIQILTIMERLIANPEEYEKVNKELSKNMKSPFVCMMQSGCIEAVADKRYLLELCADTLAASFSIWETEESTKKIDLSEAQDVTFKGKSGESLFLKFKSKPVPFYHSALMKASSVFPLMHFGTLRAAQERLISLRSLFYEDRRFQKYIARIAASTGIVSENSEREEYISAYFLRCQKPLLIPDLGNFGIEELRSFFVNYMLFQNPETAEEIDVLTKKDRVFLDTSSIDQAENIEEYKALLSKLPMGMYQFIFEQPKNMALAHVKKELSIGNIFPIVDEKALAEKRAHLRTFMQKMPDKYVDNINRTNLMLQRFIRYFEAQGYDGFVYENACEDKGNYSYMIFRPEQAIKCCDTDKELPLLRDEKREQKLDAIKEAYHPSLHFEMDEEALNAAYYYSTIRNTSCIGEYHYPKIDTGKRNDVNEKVTRLKATMAFNKSY